MVKRLIKRIIAKVGRKLIHLDFISRPAKKLLLNYPLIFSHLQVVIVSRNDKERTYESPKKNIVYQELLEEIRKK